MQITLIHNFYKNMRFIFLFFVIIAIVTLSFFSLSCSRNSKDKILNQAPRKEKNSNVANSDDAIVASRENITVFQCKLAHSADIVFISDPIFALRFVTDTTAKHHEFYAMALQRNVDAHMFVIAEKTAAELFQSSVEELPEIVKQDFKPLSKFQISVAMRSDTLVFSPLMRLFAPMQIQYMETYREKCNLPSARTLYNGSIQRQKNTMTVRYTKAIQKLASIIASYMKEKNVQDMVAILDASNMQNTENINILVTALRNILQNLKPTLRWHKRTPDSENITFGQLDDISEDAVILLYAGMYTTKASYYLRDQQGVDVERVFAIVDWEYIPYKGPHTENYGIYASAWVATPLSTIFENKNYVNAKLYRLFII